MAHTRDMGDPKYDSHFAAIGRLADIWALLEFEIDQAIWEFAEVEQMYGACITAQLIGINGRLRALASLVKIRTGNEDLAKKVNIFAADVYSLSVARNRAVHDPRMRNATTDEIDRREITADRTLVFEFRTEDAKRLDSIRNEIGKKAEEFATLHEAIRAALQALPETDRPKLTRIKPVKKVGESPSSAPAKDGSQPQSSRA